MECKAFRGRDAKGKRLKSLKNILPLCIAIILTAQSCFSGKNKVEDRIIKQFKEEYQIDVEVEKVTRALHLDWKSFKYLVSLEGDPLSVIGGLYSPKEDKFFQNDLQFAIFQSKFSMRLKDLTLYKETVSSCSFRIANADDLEFQIDNITELSEKYKSQCRLNIHIYCFDYTDKKDIEWIKFQQLIDYLKEFPNATFSFAFVFYPPETFNSEDLLANGFGFSYNYKGFETSFEGLNLDKRIDHMEHTRIGLDSLEALWNAKLLEVEMQKEKD